MPQHMPPQHWKTIVAAVLSAAVFALGVPAYAAGPYADIITANENIETGSVLVNNEDNTFTRIIPDVVLGSYPNYVAAADFNEDDIPDLVAVNGRGGHTLGFLKGKGNGEFEPRTIYDVGYEVANGVAMGDFNKDGHLDILVPNWNPGGMVQILAGDGNGNFSLSATWAVDGWANNVTVGDYNKDGNLDGAVCNWTSSEITILYGNGNGGFLSDQKLATEIRPQNIQTSDFDHDGDDDLVLACALNPAVTVFWNNGDNTFTRQELSLNTDLGGSGIVRIGDFNNDTYTDLVTFTRLSGQWFLSVFLWDAGNQEFVSHLNSQIENLVYTPSGMATADFNGDGLIDVVFGNLEDQKVSVYLGNGDGTLAPASQIDAAVGGIPVGLTVLDLDYEPPFPSLGEGLLLKYTFSHDNGSIVLDESGNGHNAAVLNGAAYTSEGRFGGAYHFDGSNDVILVNDDLGYQPAGTISFWMKADTVENWRNPFSTDYASWDDNIRFEESVDGKFTMGALGLSTVSPAPEGVYEETYTDSLQANRWYHVVYAWDGARDYGYLDGQLVFTSFHPAADVQVHPNLGTAGSYRPITLDLNHVAVGNGYSTEANRHWKGFVDEVYIYNRVISSEEVLALYNGVSRGRVYQDFEAGNGTPAMYCQGINGATAGVSTNIVRSGNSSCEQVGSTWGGITVYPQSPAGYIDFDPEHNDRLSFWIYPLAATGPNNVAVRFFDDSLYDGISHPGFEVWTTKKVEIGQWSELTVLFSQLPDDFNLNHVVKINFVNYHAGTYYFDDMRVVLGDRPYQAFEQNVLDGPLPWGYPGGAWFGTAGYSGSGEPVYEGTSSWKLVTNPGKSGEWAGVWLISQERACDASGDYCYRPDNGDDYRHVNLNPAHLVLPQFDKLTFWVYQLAENGMSNNVNVQLLDNGDYRNSPLSIWTEKSAEYGQWTRLDIPFSAIQEKSLSEGKIFNLQDLYEVKLQIFWPGTYYFDDIRATALPEVTINQAALPEGVASWNKYLDGAHYTLQQSAAGSEGPWTTIYSGTETSVALQELESSWLRVRWGIPNEIDGVVLVESDWSEAVQYFAKPALIKYARLQEGYVEWTAQPLAVSYVVEEGASRDGGWTQIYSGPQTTLTLSGSDIGKWYRVRAVGEVDSGAWSPALLYDPQGFVRAAGLHLREQNGAGDVVQLKGVNLGNYLLLESWMLGKGPEFEKHLDEPEGGKYFDDWTIREYLGAEAQNILNVYQDAYIQESDFDNILRMGFNYVRLPLYYRNICDLDESGNWACGGNFDFSKIDEIVNACADRGIYVLLDLHGAPGSQSREFHTGRESVEPPEPGYFHQLFNPAVSAYRDRTVELWNKIADHYKDNPAVLGYDLLNEPTGFEDYVGGLALLHALYDDIYQEIRDTVGDEDHLIVMEGAWDWDSLPKPEDMSWENVMYQFHYYCWENRNEATGELLLPVLGETCPAYNPEEYSELIPNLTFTDVIDYHKAFVDQKVSDSQVYQEDYDVPVLVGEFNAFGIKDAWEYYLSRFNAEGWSWSLWSYKVHSYPNNWGLYNHFLYDETLPNFDEDSQADLERKLSKYDTALHHVANVSLINAVTGSLDRIDYDGDGLSDAVDGDVTGYSNSFNDHSDPATYGEILSRGDQVLTIVDDFDPLAGVRIKVDASGGAVQAEVTACSEAGNIFLSPGDEVVVTCGSIGADIVSGPVNVELNALSGDVAAAVLETGDKIIFYPDTLTLINNGTRTVVLTFRGRQIAVAAGTTEVLNHAPQSQPGSDWVVECTGPQGCAVVLDGSASTDEDGDPLTYLWSGPWGNLSGVTQTVTLPLGVYSFSLTVEDPMGAADSQTGQVTVRDTTPPQISVSVNLAVLWPPNHKMVKITPVVTAADTCDPGPLVRLTSITMNEGDQINTYDPNYDAGVPDGDTTADIRVDANGQIYLRAERQGSSNGRIYTLLYSATDVSGNSATAAATVTVPRHP